MEVNSKILKLASGEIEREPDTFALESQSSSSPSSDLSLFVAEYLPSQIKGSYTYSLHRIQNLNKNYLCNL